MSYLTFSAKTKNGDWKEPAMTLLQLTDVL